MTYEAYILCYDRFECMDIRVRNHKCCKGLQYWQRSSRVRDCDSAGKQESTLKKPWG